MHCDDVRVRFDDVLSGTSSAGERSRTREHLASCDGCRAEWEFAEGLLRDLAELRSVPPPPVDVSERVMRGISARAARSTWPWAVAVAAAFLVSVSAAGWYLAPAWSADAARLTARMAAKAAENAPGFLSAAAALTEGLRQAARAVLPDLASLERARPVLLVVGHLLIGAVVAATMAFAPRVRPAARRRSGDRS